MSFYISCASAASYTARRMPQLREILCTSVLAADQPVEIVGQIVSRARDRNEAEGITGLLVFDGMRFCHHFEGAPANVGALVERLRNDPRHTGMTIRFEGTVAQRRYPRFDLGLAEVEDVEELAELESLSGEAALQRFLALRSGFDIAG